MSLLKKFLLLIAGLLFFIFPSDIFAQEKIDEFKVNIIAHQDGRMTIEENIIYDFGNAQRHGIYREIPLVSKVGELYRVIKIDFLEIKRNGQEEDYKVDAGTEKVNVRIGDPNETITGVHDYLIKYEVENGIGSNYEDHDEIYWDVTGNDWEIPINFASANIFTDFGIEPNKVTCFSRPGNFNAQFCNYDPNPPFNPIVTTSPLQPGDGLTIVAAFPVNTFPKSELQRNEPLVDPDFTNFLKLYLPLAGILNFALAPYLLFWYLKSKSKQRFGSPSVNFDIPRDSTKAVVTPAEAGIIDNIKLERNDVIATIFDLAIRKYIKIEEIKTIKRFSPDQIDYKIIQLKEYDGANIYEEQLLKAIFKGKGKVAMLKDFKDFYLTFQKMEDEVFHSLIRKGFYHKNPKVQMSGLMVLGIISLATLNLILGSALIYLSRKLNGRTQLGDKIDFQVDGLKIFLKSMSRHHGWQAKNFITVEKYIPYAIALGLHDDFMEQLKIVAPNYKPSWYTGRGSFYTGYSGMYSSMNSSITTSAPSSSSGFSGGSSGGGGGGGGGGSW